MMVSFAGTSGLDSIQVCHVLQTRTSLPQRMHPWGFPSGGDTYELSEVVKRGLPALSIRVRRCCSQEFSLNSHNRTWRRIICASISVCLISISRICWLV